MKNPQSLVALGISLVFQVVETTGLDPSLLYEMALELKRLYAGEEINKILTIEASGIAMAGLVGFVFGCPLVFAKKSKSRNISDNVYSVEVESFTHGNTNTVVVSREYLGPEDRILIIDDFLATGAALVGLKALAEQAGATVFTPLYKILGIALVVHLGGQLCRDAGESALAAGLETAGSVCAMLAALPLLERVLSLLGELMMTG